MSLPASSLDLPDPEARHVLRFAARDVFTALDAVRHGLAPSRAEVCNLQLKAVGDLSVFLSIKLLVHPVIAFAIVSFAGADPVWLATAVIMAALPPATNVFVLATQYRRFIEGASNAVLVGTAVSAVTVTAILYALRSGAL